uniref:Secreted protein n=1 Tax=Globodera pallida TaxID=36090 RepID=A0A183BQN4_GLOPA
MWLTALTGSLTKVGGSGGGGRNAAAIQLRPLMIPIKIIERNDAAVVVPRGFVGIERIFPFNRRRWWRRKFLLMMLTQKMVLVELLVHVVHWEVVTDQTEKPTVPRIF